MQQKPQQDADTAAERPLGNVRVLVLSSAHSLTDHRVYGKIVRSLKELGADVTLVGVEHDVVPADVRVIGLPPTSSRWRRILLQPWRCLWRSRRTAADVVHFHDAEMLVTLPVARLMRPRTKFIYDVHEDISQLIRIRHWIPGPLRRLASWGVDVCEKSLARLAHAILGVTAPLTEKYHNPLKATARNFVTRDYFELAKSHARPLRERTYDVVHLGALSSARAAFLAEVFGESLRRRPASRLLVLGCCDEMRRIIEPLLPRECEIIGHIPHREIAAFLGNAKIGLDIHPWAQPHLDVALPVKVCEYLASGCGVVASPMPVLAEIYAKSGANLKGFRLLESDSPVSFAEALCQMLDDIEKNPRLGDANREFAKRFLSWDGEVEHVLRLYRQLSSRCGA